jgi:hypothetical protein
VVLLDGANPHQARAHGTVSHLLWVADGNFGRHARARTARHADQHRPAALGVSHRRSRPPRRRSTRCRSTTTGAEVETCADYARVIMSGEIDMLLDEGEVHFRAGDVLVRGTNHAWVNPRHRPPHRVHPDRRKNHELIVSQNDTASSVSRARPRLRPA